MINIGRAIDLEHVKDEIRKLRRIHKIEIYRWIDEVAVDLRSRIGVPGNRDHPKKRVQLDPSS